MASNTNGNTALALTDDQIVERVLAAGDLGRLTPGERSHYYMARCKSLGLNPLTQPFGYIQLNGKLTLYTLKDATDQLRRIHGISITTLTRSVDNDLITVVAHAKAADGREDEDIGVIPLGKLSGEALCNAMMKTCTKAKRRVTLSICGLGSLDESELDTVRGAKRVEVTADGEIVGPKLVAAPAPDMGDMLELDNAIRRLDNAEDARVLYRSILQRGDMEPRIKSKALQLCQARGETLRDAPPPPAEEVPEGDLF